MTEQRTWKSAGFIAASVDGFIALPDGDLTWLTDPPPEPRQVQSWSAGRRDATAALVRLEQHRVSGHSLNPWLYRPRWRLYR